MRLVTTEQMRQLEQSAVDQGKSWADLMEHAGRGVAQEALSCLGSPHGQKVLVLVGPGNNGGDGFVAARHLHDAGVNVSLYIWGRSKAKQDVNWQLCQQRAIIEKQAEDDSDNQYLYQMISNASMIIDALLGMGISRPITGDLANIVEIVNTWRLQKRDSTHRVPPSLNQTSQPIVLSVDIPTGIQSDNGSIMGCAIQADVTVATGLPKRGIMLYPGKSYSGRLVVADIGIPLADQMTIQSEVMSLEKAIALLPERPEDSHKGTFGKVLVVAGSLHYPGAAALATAAAGRVGAGLVTLSTARSIIGMTGRSAEVTLLPLPEADMGVLGPISADELSKHLEEYHVLLVGPGIGKEEATIRFLRRLFHLEEDKISQRVGFLSQEKDEAKIPPRTKGKESSRVGFRVSFDDQEQAIEKEENDDSFNLMPVVLDADGLNIFAEIEGWYERLQAGRFILTPHPGEMKRLLKTETLDQDRIHVAVDAATHWKQIVVLKGSTTVVAAPDGRSVVYSAGNPAMATAGTGDVLSGIIAGLLAQKLALFDAAVLGVYLHAAAGKLAREELGDTGVLASDLLSRLPRVIKKLKEQ